MDECRRAFRGLHQIRVHRIEKQGDNGAGHAHILHGKRLVVKSISEQNVFYSTSEVIDILGEAEYRHDFRCRSDVES